MYSLLRSKKEAPTELEIEEALAGNLWYLLLQLMFLRCQAKGTHSIDQSYLSKIQKSLENFRMFKTSIRPVCKTKLVQSSRTFTIQSSHFLSTFAWLKKEKTKNKDYRLCIGPLLHGYTCLKFDWMLCSIAASQNFASFRGLQEIKSVYPIWKEQKVGIVLKIPNIKKADQGWSSELSCVLPPQDYSRGFHWGKGA